MPLPPVRLLGYSATRPHLRLIRLPEATVKPSPVPLNAANAALDWCLRRVGWIALATGEELWGVPIPLEGRAFRVARRWHWAPGLDERTVWYGEPRDVLTYETEPSVFVEFDGTSREIRTRVELPAGKALVSVVPEGLIVNGDALELWGWDERRPTVLAPAVHVMATSGSVVVCGWSAELAFLDLDAGTKVVAQKPTNGDWAVWGSFSPDRRFFLIDVTEEPETRTLDELAALILAGAIATVQTGQPPPYEPRWRRLAIVDTTTGSSELAQGRFDNFATQPVWVDDEWFVFSTPFQPRGLWTCSIVERHLEWIPFGRRHAPGPLANVTDLIA